MASHHSGSNGGGGGAEGSSGGRGGGGATAAAAAMSSTSSSSSPASSSSSPQADDVALENLKIEDSEDELDEGEEEEEDDQGGLDLGPIIPLKQQLELDKEDESLRRWKEQLLGSLHLDGQSAVEKEPQVKVLTLGIAAEGRPDITISLPFNKNGGKGHAFTLKEGCCYRLCFTFSVTHNIVSGLTYVNTVWKNGIRVDRTRTMLGTYGPQAEPYTYFTDEEITPSGLLARGSYSARTKFLDDDKRCYLELDYTFDIRKEWTR